MGCTACKKNLAKILIEYLAPIREKRALLTDTKIKEILREGAKEAINFASRTMEEVKRLVHLAV